MKIRSRIPTVLFLCLALFITVPALAANPGPAPITQIGVVPNKSEPITQIGVVPNKSEPITQIGVVPNKSEPITQIGVVPNKSEPITQIGVVPNKSEPFDTTDLQAIVDLLKTGPAPKFLLDMLNLKIRSLGDGLWQYGGNAGIAGDLQTNAGDPGKYSFKVNLFSGAITQGAMNGSLVLALSPDSAYDLYNGTGRVKGNNFNMSGFSGVVGDGVINHTDVGGSSLNGTTSKGFRSGSFNVRANNNVIDVTGTIRRGR